VPPYLFLQCVCVGGGGACCPRGLPCLSFLLPTMGSCLPAHRMRLWSLPFTFANPPPAQMAAFHTLPRRIEIFLPGVRAGPWSGTFLPSQPTCPGARAPFTPQTTALDANWVHALGVVWIQIASSVTQLTMLTPHSSVRVWLSQVPVLCNVGQECWQNCHLTWLHRLSVRSELLSHFTNKSRRGWGL
jgi:hypothetical protein